MGREARVTAKRRKALGSFRRPLSLKAVSEAPKTAVKDVSIFVVNNVIFSLVDVLNYLGQAEVWCDLSGYTTKVDFTVPTFRDRHVSFRAATQSFLPRGIPVRFKLPLPLYVLGLADSGVIRKGYYYLLQCKTPDTHCHGCGCMPFAEFEIPLAVRIEAWCEKVL